MNKGISLAAVAVMTGSLMAAPLATGAQTIEGGAGASAGMSMSGPSMGMSGGMGGMMQGSGSMQMGPGSMMGSGGGMGHEDPMLNALFDLSTILDGGLIPSICSSNVVGPICFENLKGAVKRGSKTYSKLVKDLTNLQNQGEIGSMQVVVDLARMIDTHATLSLFLSAADAGDAGDPEDALRILQSIPSKKGPLGMMIKGLITHLQSMSEEMADQTARFEEDAQYREEGRAARKAQEAERRTAEKSMRETMMQQGGPGMMGGGMGQGGMQNGMPMNGAMNGMPNGAMNGTMNGPMNGSMNGMMNGQMMGNRMNSGPRTIEDAAKMYESTNPGQKYTPEMAVEFNKMQQNGGMHGMNAGMQGNMQGGMQGGMGMMGGNPGMGGQGMMMGGGMMPPPQSGMMGQPMMQGGMMPPPPGGMVQPPPPPAPASALYTLGSVWGDFFRLFFRR